MSNVIPFPAACLSRVDRLAQAIAEDKGPRELIELEAHPESVCVRVAGLELWLTAEEARGLGIDLIETSEDAKAKGRR